MVKVTSETILEAVLGKANVRNFRGGAETIGSVRVSSADT